MRSVNSAETTVQNSTAIKEGKEGAGSKDGERVIRKDPLNPAEYP